MTCMLWDVATGSKVTEFADHLGDVMSISINPTNQDVFISGACDAFAKLKITSKIDYKTARFRQGKRDLAMLSVGQSYRQSRAYVRRARIGC